MKSIREEKDVNDLGQKVRAYVLDGGYKPGDKIETEQELAVKFGVSRYKIRTVFNALVQQGVLTKSPRRGTFINKFDPVAMSDHLKFTYQVSNFNLYEFIEARIIIETAIMPLVVKRANPSQIAAMEEAVGRMVDNCGDPPKADEADRDFHMQLIKASGNELLASFSSIVSLLFHNPDYRKKYWNPDTIRTLAAEHREILDAIHNGDLEQAVDSLHRHLHYKQKIQL